MEDILVAEDSPHRNLMVSSAGGGGQEVAAPGRLSTSCPGTAAAVAAAQRPGGHGGPKSLPGTVAVSTRTYSSFSSYHPGAIHPGAK